MMEYFADTIKVLNNSLNSIDERVYFKLLNECEKTLKSGHKIIASGLGKNVPVCEKFVGTMVSLGMDAVFLHTNSAAHGDIGFVKKGDLVIVLTKSGSTKESVYLVDLLKQRKNIEIWLLTFSKENILTHEVGKERSLVVKLEHEGDLWNIVPNHSTTLNLIILQSIAIELSRRLGVTLEDFKRNHPGGAIGEQLRLLNDTKINK